MVSSGDAALKAVAEQAPDLIVLDLNLPVLSGFEVCRILRSRPATQAGADHHADGADAARVDRVSGLDLGADDYVTKPFSLRELAARVRAVLRRPQTSPAQDASTSVYSGTHLTADFDAVAIHVDGAAVKLTRREFELLQCLVENRSRVLSRDRLLERVWGYDRSIETRSVDVHIGRLRAKLGAAGDQIETVVGLGYTLRRAVSSEAALLAGRPPADDRRAARPRRRACYCAPSAEQHPVGGRADERRSRNGQDPGPDDAAGHSPAHRRQPPRRARRRRWSR